MIRRLAFLVSTGLGSVALHAEPWTSSRVHGSPEPPDPFVAVQVFKGIALDSVTDMVLAPGLGQWLIAENAGKVWSVPNDIDAAKKTLALDMTALHPKCDHVYALAFHPQFAGNRQIFITYTNGDQLDDGSRLSRFKVKQERPLTIDSQSEEILLTWRSGGHNGAALAFGSDGLLYLSTGDSQAPNPPDQMGTGQDVSDLLSSILRLDVDHPARGKHYAIPQDNPFLHTPGARPEIWAYGVRNPWKMSFDPPTGNLWCGDVGWQEWENIYLIERGGNYGWAAAEGSNVLDLRRQGGPSPITPPVVTHSHAEAASIIGGFVYHGKRLPELEGAYIYGDYSTGKIWALWYDGTKVTRHDEIADSHLALVTFARDAEGELYFAHFANPSTLHRLTHNPKVGQSTSFPRTMGETGVFANVAEQAPAPGVHPFEIRAPMWADGATGRRFVGIPAREGGVKMEERVDRNSLAPRMMATWPKDSVLVKTMFLEMKQGDPASVKNIETQMLHFDGDAWNAYSYRWNDAGTDAELVGSGGDERTLELEGASLPEGRHRYSYRFHSRAECMRCHNSWSDFTLSFNPQQLASPEQLLATGCFDAAFMKSSEARVVNPYDGSAALEARARSWLHANCAACHREHGGGSVPLMVNAEMKTSEIRAIDEKLTRGDFGIAEARVIASGLPGSSVLLHRIAKSGAGHMPLIGPHETDVAGLALLQQWVLSIAPGKPQPVDPNDPRGALNLAVKLDCREGDRGAALQAAKFSPNAHIRELLDRFLPDSQRVETLGVSASADKILKAQGDARRGAKLFTAGGKAAACTTCHFINGVGRDFGPDLSKIGARATVEQVIESILTPSKVIAPAFQAFVITLRDGSVQAGFIVKRDGDGILLKTPSSQTISLRKADVQSEQALPTSLMPEGLLQGFTAQEAADLVSYLSGLK